MSFVVNLNSNDGDGDNQNKTFMIDWSFFEDGDYELTFCFKSSNQTEANFTTTKKPFGLALPDLNLKNVITAEKKGRAMSSPIIGQLQSIDHTRIQDPIYYISHISNMPVMCSNPTATEFRVQMLDVNNTILTQFLASYNLILYFKKL